MAAAALVRVLEGGSQEHWERAVELMAHMSACERAVAWVQFVNKAASGGNLARAMVQCEQCRFVFEQVVADVRSDERPIPTADTAPADSRGSSLYEASIYGSENDLEFHIQPSPYVRPSVPRQRPQSAPASANEGTGEIEPMREGESMVQYAQRVLEDREPRSDLSTPPHIPRRIPPPRREDNRPQTARVRDNMDMIEEREVVRHPVVDGWPRQRWHQNGAGV